MLRRFTASFPIHRQATISSSSVASFSTSQVTLAAAAAAKLKSFTKTKQTASTRTASSSSKKKPAVLAKAAAASAAARTSTSSTTTNRKMTTQQQHEKQLPVQQKQQEKSTETTAKPNRSTTSPKVELNAEQRSILNFILKNPSQSVFITGSGGTGKSVLIREIAKSLPAQSTFLTAPTGVAALNIGGITLHAFLRLQPDQQYDLRSMFGKDSTVWGDVQRRFWQCNTLIIDEISMVDPSVFQALDRLAQIARSCPKPFGGMQLILCGDFLQLPPVNVNAESGLNEKEDEEDEAITEASVNGVKFQAPRRQRWVPPNRCKADTSSKYCFQTNEWKRLKPKLFNLTQVMRQKEPELIDLLNKIRFGKQTDAQMKKIFLPPNEVDVNHDIANMDAPVRIFCRNREVNGRNRECFNTLKTNKMMLLNHYDESLIKFGLVSPTIPRSREVIYTCATVGDARVFGKVIPKRLPLCVGSRVMLLKNLDVMGGLVNGSTGVVVGFFDSSTANCEEVESMAFEGMSGPENSSGSSNAPITTLFAGDFGDQMRMAKKGSSSNSKSNKNNKNKKSSSSSSSSEEKGIVDNMKVSPEDFLLQYRDFKSDKLQQIEKGSEIWPVVKFNGVSHPVVITPTIWKQKSGNAVASKLLQLPLRHAWAITSHKAQGMTFEKVHVDLTNAFERGQAYVALSRARTIEHLKVTGYDAKKVQACDIACNFHYEVEKISKENLKEIMMPTVGEDKSTEKK